ncbi:MAG: hypothetical protein DSZ31_00235, partial [Gammaproteobacteria bacterium]
MPTLFIIAVILMVRVLTLEIPTGQLVLKKPNESILLVSDKGELTFLPNGGDSQVTFKTLGGDKLLSLQGKFELKLKRGKLLISEGNLKRELSADKLLIEVKGNFEVKTQKGGLKLSDTQVVLSVPKRSSLQGLDFLWNPNWDKLKDPNVWISAVGQIFFTLSLGFGAIITYASYVRRNQDIVLSGLAASSLNETAEVILGASIAIPAAVAFFGIANAVLIAEQGAFMLGFVSLPAVFSNMEAGQFLGFLWFFLLFIAGITSSLAMGTPWMGFVEDEFNWSRKKSAYIFGGVVLVLALPTILFFESGVFDEYDYWTGTVALVIFAMAEVILFGWYFGMDNAWEEITRGAEINVP